MPVVVIVMEVNCENLNGTTNGVRGQTDASAGAVKLPDEMADHLEVPELTDNAISRMLDGTLNKKIIVQVLLCDNLTF